MALPPVVCSGCGRTLQREDLGVCPVCAAGQTDSFVPYTRPEQFAPARKTTFIIAIILMVVCGIPSFIAWTGILLGTLIDGPSDSRAELPVGFVGFIVFAFLVFFIIKAWPRRR